MLMLNSRLPDDFAGSHIKPLRSFYFNTKRKALTILIKCFSWQELKTDIQIDTKEMNSMPKNTGR